MRRGVKAAAVLAVIVISVSAVRIIAYNPYNADRPFDTEVGFVATRLQVLKDSITS